MNPVSYYADKYPEEISRLSDDVLRKLSFQQRKLDDVQENLETAPTSTEIFVAEIYTAVAAISISCNFLLLFLISRKKYPDEESNQPIYHRIMCALAITSSFSAGNYFVAGINGSLAKNMNFNTIESSKSYFEWTKIVQESSDTS